MLTVSCENAENGSQGKFVKVVAGSRFDYVIVGGGSAGCVLAARLSENPSTTVLMLEAGHNDANPFIHIPAGIALLNHAKYEWGLETEPQRHADGKVFELRQARVLGGGGSINTQIFMRGAPYDYDTWASKYGADGWSFNQVAPVFRRFERNERFAGPHHGVDGPLGISDQPNPSELSRAFIEAGQEYGLPFNPDFNGARQHGVGMYQKTVWKGRRSSTAVAYLHGKKRPNLSIATLAQVERILLDEGRATGVQVSIGGERMTVHADREVILSAGAYFSPHLLQLSGIGDPADLAVAGIPLRHALPGVGKNLQDHPRLNMVYGIRQGISIDRYRLPVQGGLAAMKYAALRKGPLTSTLAEAGAFAYANPAAPAPELQAHFVPAMTHDFRQQTGYRTGHGISIDVYTLRPESRGTVRTVSADPYRLPKIDPNFLATPGDVDMSVAGLTLMRDLMAQPAMTKYVCSEYLFEFDAVRTPEEHAAFVRSHIHSACHQSGTCAMGTGDDAVVDARLKVHGVDGLRVVDASIMPTVVSGNTQAPTVMIAEMGADLIKADA